MAQYFTLTRLGSKEPAILQDVDRAICQNIGTRFDDISWTEGWYDLIGFRLAMGHSFSQITDYLNERIADTGIDMAWRDDYRTLLRINHYLMDNYTSDAWCGR